jgi:hypothetical protein
MHVERVSKYYCDMQQHALCIILSQQVLPCQQAATYLPAFSLHNLPVDS